MTHSETDQFQKLIDEAVEIGYRSDSICAAKCPEFMDFLEDNDIRPGQGLKLIEAYNRGHAEHAVDLANIEIRRKGMIAK